VGNHGRTGDAVLLQIQCCHSFCLKYYEVSSILFLSENGFYLKKRHKVKAFFSHSQHRHSVFSFFLEKTLSTPFPHTIWRSVATSVLQNATSRLATLRPDPKPAAAEIHRHSTHDSPTPPPKLADAAAESQFLRGENSKYH
jgi:hypothetical protein